DGLHAPVAFAVGQVRQGVAEVVVGDGAVAAVEAVGEPGEQLGEAEGRLQRQRLQDANADADGEVDEVVEQDGAWFRHGVPSVGQAAGWRHWHCTRPGRERQWLALPLPAGRASAKIAMPARQPRRAAMKRKHSPPARTPRRYWPWLLALVVFPAIAAAWLAVSADGTGSPPGPAPEGMVWVPPGWFWMGSDEFEDARPVHRVWVDGFWMDRYEVTNEQF